MHRHFFKHWFVVGVLSLTSFPAARADEPTAARGTVGRSNYQIGFTEFRANLPGGRHANVVTMRAALVRADGSEHRLIAEELNRKPSSWTQFAGWSPDGKLAIVGNGWESPENAAWEEQHKQFHFSEGWLYDSCLFDLASGKISNVTAVERVSTYNTGLFFWPGDPSRLGFQALIEGKSHPFHMDRDGRNKQDLTKNSKEFAYGFNSSPDGRRIAYHKSYQVYLADADGGQAHKVETGQPFNFAPQWSPDGQRLVFVAGEHYNCHPYVIRRDGAGLRKLADRNGFRGVVEFLDVPDFHGGSSDTATWSHDSQWVYFSAKVGDAVELMRVSLDGRREQLTRSKPGSLNYHAQRSPDGRWLVFGSTRNGPRQLFVMNVGGGEPRPITPARPGWAAMWPHWQPIEAAKP